VRLLVAAVQLTTAAAVVQPEFTVNHDLAFVSVLLSALCAACHEGSPYVVVCPW
jgi:hypothetical protein